MKKTLFAMLALATMMPAMAENWKLVYVYADPYEEDGVFFTDHTKYSFYLTMQDNTDITSVKTMLEGKTFSEFTTTSGDSLAFTQYKPDWSQLCMPIQPYAETEFSTTLVDGNYIWGVCVYQNEDVVRFQVLQVESAQLGCIAFDTDKVPGSGYTSFSSGSPTTPEPATATLSLLALAGLATRRRRK